MADLTTITQVKLYGAISGTTYDTKLSSLLTAASRFVEGYCDRLFISAAYTEYCDGREDYITLNAYPITLGPRIRAAVQALEISNTDATTNQRATVSLSVTAPAISLTKVVSGTSSTNTLSVSTYTTLSTMAAAIIAVGSGWTATPISGYESFPTADLRAIQGVVDARNEVATLELFEDFSGIQRTDLDTGTVWGCFPPGTMNIQSVYTGGYSAIPDDVVAAVCEVTLALHRMGTRDATLKSEKLGDYAYTNFDQVVGGAGMLESISPIAAMLLRPYKRVRAL